VHVKGSHLVHDSPDLCWWAAPWRDAKRAPYNCWQDRSGLTGHSFSRADLDSTTCLKTGGRSFQALTGVGGGTAGVPRHRAVVCDLSRPAVWGCKRYRHEPLGRPVAIVEF